MSSSASTSTSGTLPATTTPPSQPAKPTVLLILSGTRTPEPDLPAAQWARLNALFTFLTYDGASTSDYLSRLASPTGPYANVAAIVRTGWLKAGPYAEHKFFTPDLVARMPDSLELICCSGHGHDAADVRGLKERGIAYCNTPDTCTEAVANTALHLILASYRYFTFAERCARGSGAEGDEYAWARSRELGSKAEDPTGQVLGIVGMGVIGESIAKKAAAGLGMRIHYFNRRPNRDAEARLRVLGGATYHASLSSLLAVADCICLACPLTPQTRHLISAATLAKTKASGVRIVNIARGGLIDEDALITAMETGRVLGVGLDVHANEPGVNPRLRDNWMTTVLPHVGGCSQMTWREFDRVSFENLEEWFYGDKGRCTTVEP